MSERPGRRRSLNRRALLALGAFVALIVLLAAPGSPDWIAAGATVAALTLSAGVLAGLWMAGAIGLGRAFAPALSRINEPRTRWALQTALGVALMLSLAHALGALGLLNRWSAWAPTLIGMVALVHQVRSRRVEERTTPGWRWPWWAGAIPVALMCVAASNPPGTLWASEGRGYDVLSYHLTLAREWIDRGRIAPLEHNVYSFLPSYVEAAYTQLALMLGAGAPGGRPRLGLGDGLPVHAAAFLHVAMAIATSLILATLVAQFVQPTPHSEPDDDNPRRRLGAAGAALAFLATPWIIVTASLAYNEMGVTLLFAAALLISIEQRLGVAWRVGLAAFLVGVACSAKPTALLMVGAPVALTLATRVPLRQWWLAAIVGVPVGLLTIAPWLVRNWAASANPLFPEATSLFGTGHWSEAQLDRWNDAHHLSLPIASRIARLFDPAYGLTHPQWSILFPITALAAALALARRDTRTPALLLTAIILLQFLAWLAVGHLQSRFLIPVGVPATALIGCGLVALLRSRAVPRPVAVGAALAGPAVLMLSSVAIFLAQNNHAPNLSLVGGVRWMNGSAFQYGAPPGIATPEQRRFYEQRPPSLLVNALGRIAQTPNPVVLLVGDATPLYLGGDTVRILYTTTWDAHPLAERLRDRSNDPGAALASLRADLAITHLLVNFAEIDRLERSGYLDPAIGLDALRRLLANNDATVLAAWPEAGVALVALR